MKNKMINTMKILSILLFAAILSGCVQSTMDLDVKSPEDIEMNYKILYSPLATENNDSNQNSLNFKTDTEDIEKEISESLIDAKVEKISEEINDETWQGVLISGKMKDEVVNKILKVEDNKMILTISNEDFANENSEASESNSLNDEKLSASTAQMLSSMGMKVVVRVSMPNPITANIGDVNGNTVEIDLLNDIQGLNDVDNKDVIISCDYDNAKEVMNSSNNSESDVLKNDFIDDMEARSKQMKWMIIIASLTLFMIIIFIVLYIIKKNKHTYSPMDNQNLQNQKIPSVKDMNKDLHLKDKENHSSAQSATKDLKPKYCPQCGHPLNPDDEYCRQCGYHLWK